MTPDSPGALRTTLSPWEAAVVAAICFGGFALLSVQRMIDGVRDQPFTDGRFFAMAGLELALAAVALAFLRWRGFDIASLAPRPTWRGGAMGLALFVATWIAGVLATAPFAGLWEQQPIARMVAEAELSIAAIVVLGLANGTFEEMFFLGVLVRGLRTYGMSLAIGLPLLVRLVCHLYQGPVGALWVTTIGLVFTLAYLRWPALWPPVFAHVLFDIVAFVAA